MRRQLLFALAGVVAVAAPPSAAAAPGFGLGQLPGPDACYAQRQDDSDAAAACRVGKGLIDASAPAVSPDGTSVYVVAPGSDAIAVFARDPAGALRETSCSSNNGTTGIDGTYKQCADGDALRGATGLAVSPDGRNVYVASYSSAGIAVFARDAATGRLKQVGCVRAVATCAGARGLAGATAVAVSPDGANVYLASADADAVVSFARDPATGTLKGLGCISDDGTDRMCGKGNALRGADAIVVSPDGRFVYVAGGSSGSVLTFARDPATGTLTQRGCLLQDAPQPGSCTRGRGLDGASALTLAPDGRTLFVASYYGNAVAVLARDPATGTLSERGCVSEPQEDVKDGCSHASPLSSPTGIAVSPNGLRVYVSTEAGLTAFDRDRATGGLRLAGCMTYAAYWDDTVTRACQLGRGIAAATGVATTPDGRNLYVTSSGSDAVAAFGPAVSLTVTANLKTRRLAVRLGCPAERASACTGAVSLVRPSARRHVFRLAPGATRDLVIVLPRALVAALPRRRTPMALLVAASDEGRSPALRRLLLGPRSHAPPRPGRAR